MKKEDKAARVAAIRLIKALDQNGVYDPESLYEVEGKNLRNALMQAWLMGRASHDGRSVKSVNPV